LTSCFLIALSSLQGQERPVASGSSDIDELRAMLLDQQKQIVELRAELKKLQASQATPRDSAAMAMLPGRRTALGEIASLNPTAAAIRSSPTSGPTLLPRASDEDSPLQLKVGDTTIQPLGFADLTSAWKDKNAGGSVSSNFASIPYNNVAGGQLSEFRFSSQTSRLGFRVDGDWRGAHYIGYNEFDFMGTSGTNNLGVSTGAFVPRMRVFWIDVRKGKLEVLAGQNWSLLTPNRKGLSPLPEDLFVTQALDLNAVIGLPWTRQPGVRVLFHASKKWTLGASLENPDQYIGGSSGGPMVVLPSALASLGGGQLDNSSNVQLTPNARPDVIAKIAYDPTARVHLEVGAIDRTFKIWNPVSTRTFTKTGGGFSFNASAEVIRNFRVVTNNFWSDGGGRYLVGSAPDVTVRADGSLSPIRAGGTVTGIEAKLAPNLLAYAYYGGMYVARNVALDANGSSLIGYGYRGSSNAQNRTVQEVTFGFQRTLWRDARYGALTMMSQYAYLLRNPWYAAPGSPKNAHDNTVFMTVRYALPGRAPVGN